MVGGGRLVRRFLEWILVVVMGLEKMDLFSGF